MKLNKCFQGKADAESLQTYVIWNSISQLQITKLQGLQSLTFLNSLILQSL